ncbi:PLP-dependent aspartate aminotransferase family protein [Geomicrobium sp. JCM 19039]|uniref:trans-sulfuration enzyme family protein n=1 Tax=Geomicrobium sp. JCM 19039 TaxID=1460636 RepID=UPI00045F4102|nr:aminotransferase class I/II-fold pyridoxal phosphate-dependent enzyme [Geomicrobium sp. JCM 19039]GAK10659.1 methionine gamma-lyase [Geomicrobium sp. JCM 19039]
MSKRKETEYIHGSHHTTKDQYGSLTPPIYQTSTFSFERAEIGEDRFAGNDAGFVYSRMGNPTVKAFEERMATAEGADQALAFGSGMGAIAAALLSQLKSGEHVIVSDGIYGATYRLLEEFSSRYNIASSYVDMNGQTALVETITPNTKMLFVETPINPTMKMTDIRAVAEFAKKHDLLLAVDNTFATPYLQRPLELGAHLVVHSATKYISGHGDVIAGVVAGNTPVMKDIHSYAQKNLGAILGPFDAWLLLRGMKTLAVRMDRHCSNAKKIADRLQTHPSVDRVLYPGNPQFTDYDLAKKQMHKSGAMISFYLNGGKDEAFTFLNHLKMIPLAVSLGDAETLIEHPASMTHASIPAGVRQEMGITDNLIRLSVGLEHYVDIWSDIKQALKRLD